MQIFVDGIPAGINNPIERTHVADLSTSGRQAHLAEYSGAPLPRPAVSDPAFVLHAGTHAEPDTAFHNVAVHIKDDAAAPVSPAHVSHRHEKRCGKAVELSILQQPTVNLPEKPIGPMSSVFASLHDTGFKLSQGGIGTHVVHIS